MFSCLLRWEILATITTGENLLTQRAIGGNKCLESSLSGLHPVRTSYISRLTGAEFLTD